jgi:hypothetical protein
MEYYPVQDPLYYLRVNRTVPREKDYADLNNCEKELMTSKKKEDKKRKGLTDNELELLDTYNMKELKNKAIINYIDPDVIGNKTMKRTWAKALERTNKWGFNTFVVGFKNNKNGPLCGQIDILLHIQRFV